MDKFYYSPTLSRWNLHSPVSLCNAFQQQNFSAVSAKLISQQPTNDLNDSLDLIWLIRAFCAEKQTYWQEKIQKVQFCPIKGMTTFHTTHIGLGGKNVKPLWIFAHQCIKFQISTLKSIGMKMCLGERVWLLCDTKEFGSLDW